jgi:predicted dehydrogenase
MIDSLKVRWGIIGLGSIAHQFAKELMLVKEAQIVSVASRNLATANQFAKEYNCKHAYGSYEEIFNDDEIDILYIATPHNSHAVLTIKALQNNKHVLCEKPIALNYADAYKMTTASKKHNKFLMEAFWTRFNPSFLEVFDKIKKGEIGEIRYLNADFAFLANMAEKNRHTDLNLGGGALMDIGIYPLFLAYMILGTPNEIIAKANFHESGVDLQTSMILHYENAQAVLHAGVVCSSNGEAVISGTTGRIRLDSIWHMSQSYTLFKDNYETKYNLPTKGLGYTYEIEECHKCIRNNQIESDLWSHENSLELIKLLDAVRNKIGLVFPSE